MKNAFSGCCLCATRALRQGLRQQQQRQFIPVAPVGQVPHQPAAQFRVKVKLLYARNGERHMFREKGIEHGVNLGRDRVERYFIGVERKAYDAVE